MQSLSIFESIDSAVAVQANGEAFSLYVLVKFLIRSVSCRTDLKDPLRMAFCVMMLNQISTWFSHEEYVGV